MVYLITFCTCEVPFDSSSYLKMTVMQRFKSFSFSSSTFLNTPAELSLISCGQLCLSMHSGCFHSAHFWRVIYLLADLLISDTHTHKSFTNTHATGQRAEDMLGKKTGWWSNWFNRGRMMFVQRSCPRNLFHILNPDSTSAELWKWGWWIFQKWAGSCHTTILLL